MNASLAIPGVVPLVRMIQLSAARETVRATILALFVFSYPLAITLQAVLAGLTPGTLKITATLIPATLAGLMAGPGTGFQDHAEDFFPDHPGAPRFEHDRPVY
ncbi:MAG: hypothetical protein Ct9H300mP16_18380 [Pseudomonadota bacterium]|nr:MAG: hypothetical protein Ct9H300mP16_18380 [Pseudomonadota bacterium]